MDHFLIVLSAEKKSYQTEILAVDLRDQSTQKTEIDINIFQGSVSGSQKWSFLKYGEDKIIALGYKQIDKSTEVIRMLQITIKSFEFFSVRCKEMKQCDEGAPECRSHTAQIYKDFLCIFLVGCNSQRENENQLWSFDLKNLIWKKHSTSPSLQNFESQIDASSFLIQNHLYIYGGRISGYSSSPKNILRLNLDSMECSEFKQPEDLIRQKIDKWGCLPLRGSNYKNYLFTLGYKELKTQPYLDYFLCCWNIDKNSWSIFDTAEFDYEHDDLIVYKNLLLVIARGERGTLVVATLNLEKLNLQTLRSDEEEHRASSFMNEKDSDITFKVQDKVFPAHKQVMIQKSKYFANLFSSSMVETRQNVIEISDCNDLTFQEFLRWIYCNEIPQDVHLIIKLFNLADKYLENDLTEKCLDFLKFNINADNVYAILEFARKEGIPALSEWCLQSFQNHLSSENVSKLIKYLDHQHLEEVKSENLELRDKALNCVMTNFKEIYRENQESFHFYENFLTSNIEIKTIEKFAKFIGNSDIQSQISENEGEKNEFNSEKVISKLADAVFDFVWKNYKIIQNKDLEFNFPKDFFLGLVSYMSKKLAVGAVDEYREIHHNKEQESNILEKEEPHQLSMDNQEKIQIKHDGKRKEPIRKDGLEEMRSLKKTKKTEAPKQK